MKPSRLKQVLGAIAATLAALGITVTVVLSQDGARVEISTPPSVAVDGPDADTKRDNLLKLSPAAQDVRETAAAAPEQFDMGGNLRGRDKEKAGVLDGPLASQEWPGCKTALVPSFSSRGGAQVKAIALHYTAGPNRPGWADLDGLTAYSANVRNQVSWHFGIDREGHCTFNVPTNHKAWTISNLSPETVNIEVVGLGSEPDYAGAGMAKVREVVRRVARMHGIPLQLGAVKNCKVTRPGIITHWMGGPCSGGHHDIRPFEILDVIRAIASGPAGPTRPRALPGPSPKPPWFWLAVGEWDRRQAAR